jgi:hypothetical protein
MEEIGALLALWRDRSRPSREVRRIAEAHVGELEARIAEMQAMARTLHDLVRKCTGTTGRIARSLTILGLPRIDNSVFRNVDNGGFARCALTPVTGNSM